MIKYLFVLVCALLVFSVYCQNPIHFILGEKQFDGVKIFDVIQEKSGKYWIATNQGVFLHDGYTYEKIESDAMLGASVFNFRMDKNGRIYCHNLQNQIFKFENEKIELFYTIPANQSHHNIFLEVDETNHVHIQAFEHTVLNTKGEIVGKYKGTYGLQKGPISFSLLQNGSSVSSSFQEITIDFKAKSTTFEWYRRKPNEPSTVSITNWFKINGKVYGIDQNNMAVFSFDQKSKKITFEKYIFPELKNNSLRTYVIDNNLWLAGSRNGVFVLDENLKPLFQGNAIFSNHFISDVLIDNEKNVLLSTFDNGIIVIPDLEQGSVGLPNNEKISYFISDHVDNLLIGGNQGNIYSFNVTKSQLQLIYSNVNKRPVEFMHYWKKNQSVFYTASGGFNHSSWDGKRFSNSILYEGSLKDAFLVNDQFGYCAFNYGISKIVNDGKRLKIIYEDSLLKRAHCVAKNSETGTLYAGLSEGLFLLSDKKVLERLKYKGEFVFPNAICYSKRVMYVGTQNQRLLIFKNDKVVKETLFDDEVKQLNFYNDRLFILTKAGVYSCDRHGNNLSLIQNAGKYSNSSINRFVFLKEYFYFANSQFINYRRLKTESNKVSVLPIKITAFEINDSTVTGHSFAYGRNKYTIKFSVSTLKYRRNVKYRYKLEGYKEEWHYLDYETNNVSFDGLLPGNYRFVVQAINGGAFSNPTSYSFKVKKPYYQTAWFYVLITLTLLLIVIYLYSRRIKNIERKNNENLERQRTQRDLLETELKALRSQMNPHFIFNSLNSIQDLILKEDTDASYDYIVLFAELVRNTLNYSNQDFIPFDKEIEFLNVYLSLEKLRFKDEFSYQIETNGIQGILVPSLLVQPFIENALLHGLLHRDGLKKLSIRFELNDELTCVIEDNGVGRAKSREIQERQASGHKSFALEAINKRLELINHQNSQNAGYRIEDLVTDEKATGTRVTIILPFKRIY